MDKRGDLKRLPILVVFMVVLIPVMIYAYSVTCGVWGPNGWDGKDVDTFATPGSNGCSYSGAPKCSQGLGAYYYRVDINDNSVWTADTSSDGAHSHNDDYGSQYSGIVCYCSTAFTNTNCCGATQCVSTSGTCVKQGSCTDTGSYHLKCTASGGDGSWSDHCNNGIKDCDECAVDKGPSCATGCDDCSSGVCCNTDANPNVYYTSSHACSTVTCTDYYETGGTVGATSTDYCNLKNYPENTVSVYCDETDGSTACPSTASCPTPDSTRKATCGTCKYVDSCSASAQTCANYDSGTNAGLCTECDGSGGTRMTTTDSSCTDVTCPEDNYYEKDPDSATDTNYCMKDSWTDLGQACKAIGVCKTDADCTETKETSTQFSCGICKYVGTCSGSASCFNYVEGTSCGVGKVCDGAGNCVVADECTSGACCDTTTNPNSIKAAGTVCRAAAGECDVAEVCDGTSSTCPSDSKRPSTYECRAAAPGGCDVAETCDGSSDSCPSDSKRPSTYVCRAKADPDCDLEEKCDGVSDSCPIDQFVGAGLSCTDTTPTDCFDAGCTETGTCSQTRHYEPSTYICRKSAGDCDPSEQCTGSSGTCPDDSLFPNTQACQSIQREWGCTDAGCGGDVQYRDQLKYCPGNGVDCTGESSWTDWTVAFNCAGTELCNLASQSCTKEDTCACECAGGTCCSNSCDYDSGVIDGGDCCDGDAAPDTTYDACDGREDYTNGITGVTCYYTNQNDVCSATGWTCTDGSSDDSKADCFENGDVSGDTCYFGPQTDSCVLNSGWECTNGASDSTYDNSCNENGDVVGTTCYYGSATDNCVSGSGWECSDGKSTLVIDDCLGREDFTDGIDGINCYKTDQTNTCVAGSGWECIPGEVDNTKATCSGDGDTSGNLCYYGPVVDHCTADGWTCDDGDVDNTYDTCAGREDYANGINGNTCYYTNQINTCSPANNGWICSDGSSSSTKANCFENGDVSGDTCYFGPQTDSCVLNSGWECTNGASDSTYDNSCNENGDVVGTTCYYGSATDNCVSGSGWECSDGKSTLVIDDCLGREDFTDGIDGINCYKTDQTNTCVAGSGWECTPGEVDNTKATCSGDGDTSGDLCYYGPVVDHCTASGWTCDNGALDNSPALCPGREDYPNGITGDKCYYTYQINTCSPANNGWICSDGSFDITKEDCFGSGEVSGDNCYFGPQTDTCVSNSGWTCSDGTVDNTYAACKDVGDVSGSLCWTGAERDVCLSGIGWRCNGGSTVTCNAALECGALNDCSTKECYYSNSEVYTWGNGYPSETNCKDGHDNDCDGECDYDSKTCSHGNSNCGVEITAISLPSAQECPGDSFEVRCSVSPDPNEYQVNSIQVFIDGVGECTNFLGWDLGTSEARFSCVSPALGDYTIRCTVDASKSYQSGTDKTAAYNSGGVGCCSDHATQALCEGDTSCDWCTDCSGVYYSGGASRCVYQGTCSHVCSFNQCGATCDIGTYDCNDLDSCSGLCPDCTYDDYTCSTGCSCNVNNIDPDNGQTYCEDCSVTWTADGGQNNCCGDDADENYCSGGFTSCTASVYYTDGDANPATCSCGGGSWSIGGEVSGATCCEDDLGEYAIDNGLGSKSCCNSADDCSINDICISSGLTGSVAGTAYCCFGSSKTASCASGSGSCSDEGYVDGDICYFGESCTTGGYTAPTSVTCNSANQCAVCGSLSCYYDGSDWVWGNPPVSEAGLCLDGFNNDCDAESDCGDADCIGIVGPGGSTCCAGDESNCNGVAACHSCGPNDECAYSPTTLVCDTDYLCSDNAGGDDKYGALNERNPSQGYCDGSGGCDFADSSGSCTLAQGTAQEGTGLTICVDLLNSCQDTCSDGNDNDADGCTDGTDTNCGGIETICDDGADNDCDTLIDCNDPNCAGDPACPEICNNGIDDDSNGDIDCDDVKCCGSMGPNGLYCCPSGAACCPNDDCKAESCSPAKECNYVDRARCDSTECNPGEYCDAIGGDCKSPDVSSIVCQNCESDWTDETLSDDGFAWYTSAGDNNLYDDSGTVDQAAFGLCCGNTNNEYFFTQGDNACCDTASDCVTSGGACYDTGTGSPLNWCCSNVWENCNAVNIGLTATCTPAACCAGTALANGWDTTPSAESAYSCSDNLDNDCDGTAGSNNIDYDGNSGGTGGWDAGEHGDSDCPVTITGIAVSDNCPYESTGIDVSCTVNAPGITCIGAWIDHNDNNVRDIGEDCNWNGDSSWSGNTATFGSCNVGVKFDDNDVCEPTNRRVYCYIKDQCYQTGGNLSTTIDSQPAPCDSYFDCGTCEADANCEWCQDCESTDANSCDSEGTKYSGAASRCVQKGTCSGTYGCVAGVCGAECNDVDDCTDTSQCNNNINQTRTNSCNSLSCGCEYGPWEDTYTGNFANCEISKATCGADCSQDSDCGGFGETCDLATCSCIQTECDPDIDASCCDNTGGFTPSIGSAQPVDDYAENCKDSTNNAVSCYDVGFTDDHISGYEGMCCGDDVNENFESRIASSTMGGTTNYETDLDDYACCNSDTKCVDDGMCYETVDNHDADGDGDPDVCIVNSPGVWFDCLNDDDCLPCQHCNGLTMECVNDAPTIAGIPDSEVPEDAVPEPLIDRDLYPFASDTEDALPDMTYAVVGQSNPVLINCYVGNNRYLRCDTPAANQTGFSDLTIRVTDTCGLSDTDFVRVTVLPVNDPPDVRLIYPPNETLFTNGRDIDPLGLNFSLTDIDSPTVDCTLLFNGLIQDTYLDISSGLHSFEIFPPNGNNTWRVNCTDREPVNPFGVSEVRVFEVALVESIMISNLGRTGFEKTNSEYTQLRAVYLVMSYDMAATNCRFRNENLTWSEWEYCPDSKYWLLPDTMGNITVNGQVDHWDGRVTNVTDSIIYEPSGFHLDITSPSAPTVVDEGDYSNKADSLYAYWYGANDPEAQNLGYELTYVYRVLNESGVSIPWTDVGTGTEALVEGITLADDENYTFEVRVSNSAEIGSVVSSDGIVIDTEIPQTTNPVSSQPVETWSNNNTLVFSYLGSDAISGIQGYSLALSKQLHTVPDKVQDTASGSKIFRNVPEGRYWFHVRSRDKADNWGDTKHLGWIGIDLTPPSRPIMVNPTQFAQTDKLTFSWRGSRDVLSGVVDYWLNVSRVDGTIEFQGWLGSADTSYEVTVTPGYNYIANVIAVDGAGTNSSYNPLADTTPPKLIFIKPNGTVAFSPVLTVETDEDAACKFNTGTGFEDFDYSGSRLHEHKLMLSDGDYSVDIVCVDKVGLQTNGESNFTIDTSAVVTGAGLDMPAIYYINVPVELDLTLIPALGELSRDNFEIELGGKKMDFTLADKTLGHYELYFVVQDSGTYDLKISIKLRGDTKQLQDTITINDLYQSITYKGPISSPGETERIVFSDETKVKFGLASDSSKAGVSSSATEINITSRLDGITYIFQTRKEGQIEKKDTYLLDKSFDEYTNTFGYDVVKSYNLRAIMPYADKMMVPELDLSKGSYDLMIRNLGLNDQNRTMIEIRIR